MRETGERVKKTEIQRYCGMGVSREVEKNGGKQEMGGEDVFTHGVVLSTHVVPRL